MTTNTQRLLCGIGSAVVVLCFFLPMSEVGVSAFQAVVGIFRVFGELYDLGGSSGQLVLTVVLSLAFFLTPFVCHLIAGTKILAGGRPSKGLTITPVAVWVAFIIIALIALKAAENELGFGFGGAMSFGLGFIGTWLGMLLAMIVALIKPGGPAPAFAPAGAPYTPGPAPQGSFCSQCGQRVAAADQFCPACGTRKE
jgi:hypothetical protein